MADRTAVPPKRAFGMASHELISLLFAGHYGDLARLFRISPTSAMRWGRAGEGETATGAQSPLDRACLLIDAAVLCNREQAPLLVEFLQQYLDARLQLKPVNGWVARDAADEILRASTEAVTALIRDQPLPEALQRLMELRQVAAEAVRGLEHALKLEKEKAGDEPAFKA
jgi:hypothetical protein